MLADQLRYDWLSVARSLVRGELPEAHLRAYQSDSEAWRFITALADWIRKVGPDKRTSELAEQIRIELPPGYESSHWREFNRVANFLKHAASDHDEALSEEEVGPIDSTARRLPAVS